MDVRVLKAAVEGDVIAMRELHGVCPKRLKAAHNMVLAKYCIVLWPNYMCNLFLI